MLAKLRRFICVAFILAIAPLPDGSHLLAEGVGTYQVGDAIQARLDEIAERLRADRGSAFALATLEELHDFSHWAPYGMFRDLLTEIAESDETDLLVREQAYYQLALAHFAAGDSDVAESLLRSRGYLANWSVIGPFANDGMVGFTTLYGPELERSGSAYPGKAGEVEWRDVSPYSRLGYLNVGDFCRPNHAAVSYAVTTLEVTRTSRVRLWTGANGAYKIWVNRDLVAQSPDLGGGPIREWVDIELRRGENELLIKLGNETGPMGFFLHLTDMDGDPFVVESSAVLSPIDEPVHQELSETAGGSVLGHINALFGDADLVPPEELTVSRRAAAAFLLLRNRPRDPTEPSTLSTPRRRSRPTCPPSCNAPPTPGTRSSLPSGASKGGGRPMSSLRRSRSREPSACSISTCGRAWRPASRSWSAIWSIRWAPMPRSSTSRGRRRSSTTAG